jgi:hypothetical protein
VRGEEVDCALIAVDAHPVGIPWEVGDVEVAALTMGSVLMTIDRSGLSMASQATSYPTAAHLCDRTQQHLLERLADLLEPDQPGAIGLDELGEDLHPVRRQAGVGLRRAEQSVQQVEGRHADGWLTFVGPGAGLRGGVFLGRSDRLVSVAVVLRVCPALGGRPPRWPPRRRRPAEWWPWLAWGGVEPPRATVADQVPGRAGGEVGAEHERACAGSHRQQPTTGVTRSPASSSKTNASDGTTHWTGWWRTPPVTRAVSLSDSSHSET